MVGYADAQVGFENYMRYWNLDGGGSSYRHLMKWNDNNRSEIARKLNYWPGKTPIQTRYNNININLCLLSS